MTSPRLRSSKSTSTSGQETRSGLRKRSKISPCSSGSRLRDAHGVGGHGARCGTATRADADALRLGPVDEVGHDEEVAREPELCDDARLVLGLGAHLVRHRAAVPLLQAALDLLDEPGVLALPRGNRETRHVVRVGVEGDLALLRQAERCVARLGVLREEPAHLLRRAHVVAVAVELEPVRVGERRAGVDAQERVVVVVVLRAHVVRVVRREEGRAQVLREADQVLRDARLDLGAVVHELDVDVLRTEHVLQAAERPHRLVVLPEPQARLDLSRGTGRADGDTRRVPLEQLEVHAGPLAPLAVERGHRTQPEEVVQTDVVPRPEREVRVGAARGDVVVLLVRLTPPHTGAVEAARARCHVGLEADDRLDPRRPRLAPELVGAEEVSVVRHRDGLLAVPRDLRDQSVDLGRAVEHRVLGVDVQVDEVLLGGHASDSRWPHRQPPTSDRPPSLSRCPPGAAPTRARGPPGTRSTPPASRLSPGGRTRDGRRAATGA